MTIATCFPDTIIRIFDNHHLKYIQLEILQVNIPWDKVYKFSRKYNEITQPTTTPTQQKVRLHIKKIGLYIKYQIY